MFLVPAYALVVAAPSGPDQGCPSPRQITDALNARIPDVVVPALDASASVGLRLGVTGGAPPSPLRIEITDQAGDARLLRVLQPSDRGRPNDCAALAETVALIVERYLHEVGYELPPSPPPQPPPSPLPAPAAAPSEPPVAAAVVSRPASPRAPPSGATRVDLIAGGAWRGGAAGSAIEGIAGAGVEWGLAGQRVGAILSGGASPSQSARLADGTASLRRIPVHLGLYLSFPFGPGRLEPGLGAGVDWLVAGVDRQRSPSSSDVRASPGADLTLGYRVFLADRFFLRASASLAFEVPYQFVAPSQGGGRETAVIFASPRTFFGSGLEMGVPFQ